MPAGRTRGRTRLDGGALRAVIVRELVRFRASWWAITIDSATQPLVYLLLFGVGLRDAVTSVGGHAYIDYVATGLVSTSVLATTVFVAAYGTYLKILAHTYQQILVSPTDPTELVTAEVLWIAARSGVYSCSPLLVSIPFGLRLGAGAAAVPLIAALTAIGWASVGIVIGVHTRTTETFTFWETGLALPVTMLGGVFFPLTAFPPALAALAIVNPAYHCAELVRDITFGLHGWPDAGHVAFLVLFAVAAWWLAIKALSRKLIV
jgi:lipooligosaccharide transport system permease protein